MVASTRLRPDRGGGVASPCFVNYRTTDDDVMAILDVAAELGERIAKGGR